MMGKFSGKVTIGIDDDDYQSMKEQPLVFTVQGITIEVRRFKNDKEKYVFDKDE